MIDLPPDPYQALGVPKDATIPEIRSAHRKLVLRCHPDKVQDPQLKAQKQVEFEMVQRAYELLSDDRERQKYDDRALLANLRAQFTKRAEAPAPGLGSQRAPTRPRGYDHSRSRDDIDGSRHGPTRSEVESFAEQYVSRSRPKAAKGPPTLKRSAAYTAYRSSTPPTTGSVSEGQPGARSHARAHSADESSGGQSSSGFDRFFKRGSSGRQSPGIPSPASPSFHQPQVSSSPAPGEAAGSRWNRFRRSSAPSRPRRTASRAGSQGSRASGRSVGSQVSQEDMDKFDYVLQAMEDLLDKHIKKLRGRFLRNLGRSARSHKDQCREALVTLQTKVLEQYEHNGARRGDVAESVDDHARYRLLVDLFDDLRLELADFGLHDLSRQGAGSYCTGFCSRIDSFAARLTLYGVKATETE